MRRGISCVAPVIDFSRHERYFVCAKVELYIRPPAKLSYELKITYSSNQIKSEREALSTVSISLQ